MRFSTSDREAIQRLVLDPTAAPVFDLLKDCLIWPDERPERISSFGYELLSDLWIVRGYVHRDVPSAEWGLDPAYFNGIWDRALEDIPEWPGFRRLSLSDADRSYYERQRSESIR